MRGSSRTPARDARARNASRDMRAGRVKEIKGFGSRNEIVFAPTFRGSIAATGKKPMQHGEINGPLNVKIVAASLEQ